MPLLACEKLTVELILRVGRSGHKGARVRVIGNASFPWEDAVYKWGAKLKASVADNPGVTTFLKRCCGIKPLSLLEAALLSTSGPCRIVFYSEPLRHILSGILKCLLLCCRRNWKPLQALVVLDKNLS